MEASAGAENHCRIATLLVRYHVGFRTTSVDTRTDLEIPPSFSYITASVVSCITTSHGIGTSSLVAWLLNDCRDIREGDYLIQAFDKRTRGEQKVQRRSVSPTALVRYFAYIAVRISNTYSTKSKGSASVRTILLTAGLPPLPCPASRPSFITVIRQADTTLVRISSPGKKIDKLLS